MSRLQREVCVKNKSVAALVESIRRWFRSKPDPRDPYARVRVPVRKGPGGRSASVALKEPKD